jgi:hypothetical protein
MNDWQRKQAAECGCRGTDDLCPCQNAQRDGRVERLRRTVDELASDARQAMNADHEMALAAARDAGMDLAVSPLESKLEGDTLVFTIRRLPIAAGTAAPDGWLAWRTSELPR